METKVNDAEARSWKFWPQSGFYGLVCTYIHDKCVRCTYINHTLYIMHSSPSHDLTKNDNAFEMATLRCEMWWVHLACRSEADVRVSRIYNKWKASSSTTSRLPDLRLCIVPHQYLMEASTINNQYQNEKFCKKNLTWGIFWFKSVCHLRNKKNPGSCINLGRSGSIFNPENRNIQE